MDAPSTTKKQTAEKKGEEASSASIPPRHQRLLRVDQIYSRKDRQIHFVATKRPEKPKERLSKTVLVIRRIISSKGMVASIEVDIKSQALKDVLLEIFADVEGLLLNRTPPVADPELLFHASKELDVRLLKLKESKNQNLALVNDISAVKEFISEHFGDAIGSLNSLAGHGEITYDLLWTLFAPKTLVFTTSNKLVEPQAIVAKSGSYEESRERERYYFLVGRIVSHDGYDFGYGYIGIKIPAFEGSKKIVDLAAFPFSYHKDEDGIRKKLMERGRMYAQLVEPICQEHSGLALTEERTATGLEEVKFEATGRVMVDPVAFRFHNPNFGLLQAPWVTTKIAVAKLTDPDLLICNHRVHGFSLQSKQWGAFAVSRLAEVDWNEEAYSKLIIEPKRRDLICSLVLSHRTDEGGFDDIIRNKGKGLVGLLSGSPGVGKTLTAEVVAELAHKPLYMVSVGELGTDLERLDKRLEMVLDITRKWGCVLLIDEADVFLQARNDTDLLRNALVSIFLRRLEYYQGILILTTNRKSTIDPAFQSRIHFKIHYPPLGEDSRSKIWTDLLSSIPLTIAKPQLSTEDIATLAKLELNGREIKNAISCACSMSRSSGNPLNLERMQEVLEMLVDDWTAD